MQKKQAQLSVGLCSTTRLAKGAASEGKEFIISLGRNSRTTLSSMAKLYGHCDLTGVIIQDE